MTTKFDAKIKIEEIRFVTQKNCGLDVLKGKNKLKIRKTIKTVNNIDSRPF